MITLKNISDKSFKFVFTKNPITAPFQNPQPTGKDLDTLDPDDDKLEIQQILKHPNYSPAEEFVLKPGINKIENEEWAEYIYAQLGNPEEAGQFIPGNPRTNVINKNIILEVDKDGNEIKDHFYRKYRMPAMVMKFDEKGELSQ